MVMLPKHVAVVVADSAHELANCVGFVTGVRGETSRDGRPINDGESEVTFIEAGTGNRTVRVISNTELAVRGC